MDIVGQMHLVELICNDELVKIWRIRSLTI